MKEKPMTAPTTEGIELPNEPGPWKHYSGMEIQVEGPPPLLFRAVERLQSISKLPRGGWLKAIAPQSLDVAIEAAEKWQPIDTAPKDGTDFLACWDDDELHVVCIRDGECWRAMDRKSWMMPTHWMPLPPAPEIFASSPTAASPGKE